MSAQPKNLSRSSLLIGSLLLALAVESAHAKILNPPYLQAVSMTGVCVMVECDTTNAASVAYGPTPAYGRTATTAFYLPTSNTTFVHRVWLTGLEPNSTCHYRASHGDDQSADASFQTAPPSGTPFRFAFMTDFQSVDPVQAAIVGQLIETHRPRLCVYGGDMANRGRQYELWKEHFLDKQRDLIARVPFFGAVGNHDGWVENTKAFLQAPDSGSHTQAYYSVDYSDVHFLILNTEVSSDTNSPQYAFAQADLSACTQKWKIVVFHRSAYVGGGHGEHAADARPLQQKRATCAQVAFRIPVVLIQTRCPESGPSWPGTPPR